MLNKVLLKPQYIVLSYTTNGINMCSYLNVVCIQLLGHVLYSYGPSRNNFLFLICLQVLKIKRIIFLDLVWSDPEDVDSWAMSPRGAGWLFGAKVTNEVGNSII